MKKIIAALLAVCTAITALSANVSAANLNGTWISSKGACVMDYATGEILYQHDGDTPRVPASMTKIMTMYCVYDALASGEISLGTKVPISKKVYTKSHSGEYILPLEYNAGYTVDELMDVTVTYSSASAAVALAELLGGGKEAVFVERMNNKVRQLGLNAYYYDACGLAQNKISPNSMAQLARSIIMTYPDILRRSSRKSVAFRGKQYKTTNRLLDTYYYPGADGLKTGTLSTAGYCFCGTAQRNGERIITVTMNSDSASRRFTDTTALLDYGFANIPSREGIYFTNMRAFVNGAEAPAFVYKGEGEHAAVIAEDMAAYGFDVNWDGASNTLYLSYNAEKPLSPIPLEYYKNKNGQKAFKVEKNNRVRVIFDQGGEQYQLRDVYNINGYMCISVDEFAAMYGFVWSNEERAAYIDCYRGE